MPACQLHQPQESREHIQTLAANLPAAWLTMCRKGPKKGILAFARQLHFQSAVSLYFSQLCSQRKDLPKDCCRVPWLMGSYPDIFQQEDIQALLLLLFWRGFVYAFSEDPHGILPVW